MIVTRMRVKNWRNFKEFDVRLQERQFIVGPNASGKSNLLDVFRFLRDIAKSDGGGLQKAVNDRGGVSKLRCLAARKEEAAAVDKSQTKYMSVIVLLVGLLCTAIGWGLAG